MMDNMTGKPIPNTFVTANDRRNTAPRSLKPTNRDTATPTSILKKDSTLMSTKIADSSTKDVWFTSPEKMVASGSQDSHHTRVGATSNGSSRSSSKLDATRGNSGLQTSNDCKTSSNVPKIDSITPPKADTPKRANLRLLNSRLQV